MKYGIYYAYWEKTWDADQLPYIKKVKSLGFDILEIGCGMLKHMTDGQLAEFRKEAEGEGVLLTAGYGPSAEENLASPDESVRRHAIAFYTELLRKLSLLGVHTVGGGLYSYWPVDYTKPVDKQADWERSVENVRTVGRIAGELGIRYCLESLNRFEGYLINTAKEDVEFLRQVGLPNVKVHLDTFHMNIEEDSMTDAILTAGEYLGHFHVGENNRRVPGKGNLPWAEIGKALNRVGYDGAVVMEPFVLRGGQVGSDIKIWRDLVRDEKVLDAEAAASVAYLRHVFSGPYSDYSL